ncbi:MAG: phosphotransferase [Candidatus Sumerlaeota bacterium]|nr:phosphotransferase [Candidatus Sumerlaeota bacterium]
MSLFSLFHPRKRYELDPAYVAGPLAARLGERGEDARIEKIEGATNAYVARAIFAGGADVVVRWWPWVGEKRKGAEHARLSALLAGRGAPIPEFLVHDDSLWTRWRYGGEATAERFVAAPRFDPPWTPAELAAFGAVIARLHCIASTTPGKPWRSANEQADLAGYLRARWEKCIAMAEAALGEGPGAEDAARVLQEGLRVVAERRSFELIHGDLSPKNVFRGGAKGIMLCDFGAMMFGCFEQELAMLEARFFDGRSEEWGRFLRSYADASPPERRDAGGRARPFFRAFYHLEKAYSNARRHERAQRAHRTSPRVEGSWAAAEGHWRRFADEIRTPPG